MADRCGRVYGAVLLTAALLLGSFGVQSQDEDSGRRRVETVDRAAKRLYDQALDYLEIKQYERGLTMLDTVIRDNAGNILGYRAHMAKGKHYLEQSKTKEALGHFMLLSRVLAPKPGEERSEEEQQLYKEALFNTGLAHFQAGQYASSFPAFRRLTEIAGKSKWANQAYFYIGMSHYALKNWSKAIDALALVGTEVEDTGEKIGRIEIGQRFYAKITDNDIPVLKRLKQDVKAKVTVKSGDEETLLGVPVAGKKNELLVSVPTKIGAPKPNDGILQMVGGDTVKISYSDGSTLDGKKDVLRTGTVKAVSTGTIGFYLGDLTTPAYIAYPGQPQTILLRDADLDTDIKAQTIQVTVRSMYKVAAEDKEDEDDSMLDIFAAGDKNEVVWKERDSVVLTLTETAMEKDAGDVIRSGVFVGKVQLKPVEKGVTISKDDKVLHCDELDELRVSYEDVLHLYGEEPRANMARIKVAGKVHSGVDMTQTHVTEKVLRARKFLVEAEALKGLGLIFKDMGLVERGGERADQALKKVDTILVDRKFVPSRLQESAFRLKWESEFVKNDFAAATATCKAFNRLYPESILADQALMTLSRTLAERGKYKEALETYTTVLQLKNPISAAEAQYRIGEVYEKMAEEVTKDETSSKWTAQGLSTKNALQEKMGPAIKAFTKTYQAYPESPFAALAIEKVARFYSETEDYARAADLFEKVTNDYPDAKFMDEILFLWAQIGIKTDNNALIKEKLNQLIFNYPSSKHAKEAKKILGALK